MKRFRPCDWAAAAEGIGGDTPPCWAVGRVRGRLTAARGCIMHLSEGTYRCLAKGNDTILENTFNRFRKINDIEMSSNLAFRNAVAWKSTFVGSKADFQYSNKRSGSRRLSAVEDYSNIICGFTNYQLFRLIAKRYREIKYKGFCCMHKIKVPRSFTKIEDLSKGGLIWWAALPPLAPPTNSQPHHGDIIIIQHRGMQAKPARRTKYTD